MNFDMRPTTAAENLYTYSQSQQISGQTGCIGYLRADMDTDGNGFFSTWFGVRDDLKTDEFKQELDEVINALRTGKEYDGVLRSRSSLAQYCHGHRQAQMEDGEERYGFRIDTEKHSYLLRLTPTAGEYNLYCYCYKKDWLDQHMREAAHGIRFIDSSYHDKFRLPDGGKIRITTSDGKQREYTCRFIDPYHLEVGSGAFSLYHICEFAERMERNGSTVEPLNTMPVMDADRRQFQIYQLKDSPECRDLLFLGIDSVRQQTGKDIDLQNYKLMYQGELAEGVTLDDLYTRFNIDRPKDFTGHSLSVSDVIVVIGKGREDAYYVDSIGFAQIPCTVDREMKLPETTQQKKPSVRAALQVKQGQVNDAKPAQTIPRKKRQEELS